MRWTEADQRVRISRDVRFATLYPAQTLASCSAARSTWSLSACRENQMEREAVLKYMRELTPKAFAELFYESTRGTHPCPAESELYDGRIILAYAEREHDEPTAEWELTMVCPATEDWVDESPICQHGNHCKFETVSWAKNSRCPICDGNVYGT